MRVEDKFSEDLVDFIAGMAEDDFNNSNPLDPDDIVEFRHLLIDENFNVSLDEAKELFEYYKSEFTICKERYCDGIL